MITTDSDEIAQRARLLRDQAKVEGVNRHDIVGYNWRMSELPAILGLTQLARLDTFIEERRRVARIYDRAFRDAPACLRPLRIPAGAESNYYKYVIHCECDVESVGRTLFAEYRVRLGGTVYDVPCHQQPVFAGLTRGPLPRAEHLCRHHVCPPIYPSLTDDEARYVADSLIEVVS